MAIVPPRLRTYTYIPVTGCIIARIVGDDQPNVTPLKEVVGSNKRPSVSMSPATPAASASKRLKTAPTTPNVQGELDVDDEEEEEEEKDGDDEDEERADDDPNGMAADLRMLDDIMAKAKAKPKAKPKAKGRGKAKGRR